MTAHRWSGAGLVCAVVSTVVVVVLVVVSVVLWVVWVLELAYDVVFVFFSELGCSSSGGSVCRAAH